MYGLSAGTKKSGRLILLGGSTVMLHGTFTETYTHHVTRNTQFTKLARMPRRASRETQKMTLKAHVKLVNLKRSQNSHNFWARKKNCVY